MEYRCVATSAAGFVQQLAVGYIAKGYLFYVSGTIPPHKDPKKTDKKIIEAYTIALSKWTRSRRKRTGLANIQYLRFERFYVIIATHGVHRFFEAEGAQIHDVRRRPILFRGYSIGCRRARGDGAYHASVRINRELFKEIREHFAKLGLKSTVEELWRQLNSLPFEPYAPVRQQMLTLRRMVNKVRTVAGLEPIPSLASSRRRTAIRPFYAVCAVEGDLPLKDR
jgi:hypothetical protein